MERYSPNAMFSQIPMTVSGRSLPLDTCQLFILGLNERGGALPDARNWRNSNSVINHSPIARV